MEALLTKKHEHNKVSKVTINYFLVVEFVPHFAALRFQNKI